MSKSAPSISVLTANRLGDGVVVFLDFEGAWVESLARSRGGALARRGARAARSRGAFDAARNIVVEPYLVEVQRSRRQPGAGALPRARAPRRPQHPRRRAGLRGDGSLSLPSPHELERAEKHAEAA